MKFSLSLAWQGLVVAMVGLWALRQMLIKVSRGWLVREASWLEGWAARCRPGGRVSRWALRHAQLRRDAADRSGGCGGGCGACGSRSCQGDGR